MPYVRKRAPLDPCPVEEALAVAGGKWKVRLLAELADAPAGFATLRRALPGISQQVLAAQLDALIADRLIARDADPAARWPRYRLTRDGHTLVEALTPLAAWGQRRLAERGIDWSPVHERR